MLVDENFKQRLRRLFSVMIPILITQTATPLYRCAERRAQAPVFPA